MPHPHLPARTVSIQKKLYQHTNLVVDVLRLDEIHPTISGNKWFKLKNYLADAQAQQKNTIVTFGGAFSNHIVATAAAAQLYGQQSVGIIRGEKPLVLSPTLTEAKQYGMQLFFISREDYKEKKIPQIIYNTHNATDIYIVNEGGYGVKGMEGAMDILKSCNSQAYDYIIAAVGTGTTLAGLITFSKPHQQVIGISALKNNFSLEEEVKKLLPVGKDNFLILHNYSFGGYAKHTPALFAFMNDWYDQTGIPTDFVYTAKTFYAAHHLIENNYFKSGAKILLIHSGGLQGNRSLPKGTLIF